MSEKIQSSEIAQSSVSSDAASADQLDSSNTKQTEKEQTTMLQEPNKLVERAMNGDADAFNQLLELCFSISTRYSYRLSESLREEFLQDMDIRLFTCITNKKWQDTGKPFESWIHATARNALLEWWRRDKKRSAEIQDPEFSYEEIEDTDSSIIDQMLQQEEKTILWGLVTSLPKIPAIVIYQHYACKKSFAEIGEQIEKTEANCRKIHQRALESLRQLAHASGYYPEKEKKIKKDSEH